MTCVVGLAVDGTVYIGADSAGAGNDWSLTVRTDEKVFRNGDVLLGFTSSFRMGQLLQYAFRPPLHDPSLTDHAYMVTTFVDAVRDCLKTGGFARRNSEVEEGGTFLVGYRGAVYVIHDDYQVSVPADGYAAVGCAAPVAHGALFATSEKPPRDRVERALQAAERFSAAVRGPFVIQQIAAV